MITKTKTASISILLIIIIVLLAVWSFAYFSQPKKSVDTSNIPAAPERLVNQTTGTVTVVNENDNTILLQTNSGEAIELNIVSDTIITENLVHIDASSTTRILPIEVNAKDIPLGSELEVTYVTKPPSESGDLVAIDFTTEIDEEIQTYLQERTQQEFIIKGQWLSHGTASNTVSILYQADNVSDEQYQLEFRLPESGVSVYKVKNRDKINIEHAQSRSSLSEIEEDQVVHVSIINQGDDASLRTLQAIFVE